MKKHTVALFGESEKGEYQHPYLCRTLEQLEICLGNPPQESQGLFFAVQALLYRRDVIFFRVAEEGYSREDYFSGICTLQQRRDIPSVSALCLPGVGDTEVIEAMTHLCQQNHSILITTSADLYDFLTNVSF